MTRDELKERIDELMSDYADEKIDGATYLTKMMELTTSSQNENIDDWWEKDVNDIHIANVKYK